MYTDDTSSNIKSWILIVILFFVCVVLITPTTLFDNLEPIINEITNSLGDQNYLAIML